MYGSYMYGYSYSPSKSDDPHSISYLWLNTAHNSTTALWDKYCLVLSVWDDEFSQWYRHTLKYFSPIRMVSTNARFSGCRFHSVNDAATHVPTTCAIWDHLIEIFASNVVVLPSECTLSSLLSSSSSSVSFSTHTILPSRAHLVSHARF